MLRAGHTEQLHRNGRARASAGTTKPAATRVLGPAMCQLAHIPESPSRAPSLQCLLAPLRTVIHVSQPARPGLKDVTYYCAKNTDTIFAYSATGSRFSRTTSTLVLSSNVLSVVCCPPPKQPAQNVALHDLHPPSARVTSSSKEVGLTLGSGGADT